LAHQIIPKGSITDEEKRVARMRKKMWVAVNFLERGKEISNVINDDKKIRRAILRDSKFDREFEKGLWYYRSGQWRMAHNYFMNCVGIRPSDGPTNCLIKFMRD
jgi:hypothetical protein